VVESKMRYHPRRDLPELQGVGGIANWWVMLVAILLSWLRIRIQDQLENL
jgi:hypothetical protein